MRPIDADALFKAYEKAAWYNNADRDEIAEEILLQMPTIEQPQWISCAERLPEPNENPVLAVFFGVVNPAWFHSGLWELPSGIISDKVTHWMPLPEPPKGDE